MKKTNGFTLIELMIVVAIVAIIAAFAYPSYQSSIRKTNRSDAVTSLLDVTQKLERCFSTYGYYKKDANNDCTSGTLSVMPSTGNSAKGYYSIAVDAVDASTYTLTATAISTERQNADTTCNKFTVTNTGIKTSKNSAGSASTGCW
ncbi:MAG TPA: type IV pilin protein [Pseudomonadales bacterium]|nr:type IV pilin protein [Pseudomonadales bacterium]